MLKQKLQEELKESGHPRMDSLEAIQLLPDS